MMKRVIYISIFVSIFGLALSTESIPNALITSIFAGYDPSVIPICRGYEQVNVSLDLGLRQLIDLNEPQQIIKLKLWIRLLWTDCLLKWNPNDYHNVSNVVVPFKNIWTPDLTLFDSVSTEFWGLDKFRAIISFDGTVQYNFPTVMEVQCQVDVTKFPFDQQTCPLQFGSWIYTGKQLDMNLQSNQADLSELKQNVEWDVTGVPAVKHIKYYACCPDPYIDLTYNLYLKRKPRYYKTNIILPSMIITLLAALGFILPVDSGEKVSLEVTVLLSLTVFQLLIADKLPPSDEARPWIGDFFSLTLILCGLSAFVQVIVINIYHRGDRKMSHWVNRVIVNPLSTITLTEALWMNKRTQPGDKTEDDYSVEVLDINKEWEMLSICIDRVGLTVFLATLTIGSISIFANFIE